MHACTYTRMYARTHTCMHAHTHAHTFNGPMFGTIWVSGYQKGIRKDLLEQATMSGSNISWAICKSAPWPRYITMPASHHSVFLQAGCPSCHPTNSVKALKAKTRMHWESTNLCRFGGSGFRTLDSRIRSVIRIATKIVSLGPWAMPYPSEKFCQNLFTSLRVIRRTDRQTDRQTNRPHQKHNLLLRRR